MSRRTARWRSAAIGLGLASVLSVSGVFAEWNVEILQGSERDIRPSLVLAYDSAGNPSIAFGDSTAGEVRFATKAGGSWSFETIDTRPLLEINHAYDSNGKAAVSYTTSDGPGNAIYYAEKVSGNWQVTRVAFRVDWVNSLAFDASDTPSVVYFKNAKLYFASRPGSDWINEAVASNAGVLSASLTYDGNGVPHIAFIDRYTDQAGTGYLKLATRSGSSWSIETIKASSNLRIPNLAFDPANGEATVLFYHYVPTDPDPEWVDYLARKTGGSWQIDIVPLGAFGNSAYVYDANGIAHVAYRDRTTGQTLVAHETAGVWSSDLDNPLDDGGSSPSLAFDKDGNRTLGYVKYTDTGRELRFASIAASCLPGDDCDDGNECTDNHCLAGACQSTAVPDYVGCSSGVCCGGACSSPCIAHGDCDDGDICTTDSCLAAGTCSASCDNVFDVTNDPSCDTCVPTSSKEKGPRCTDGLDNDCDGWIDGDDPDC